MSLQDEPASKQDLLELELRTSQKIDVLATMMGTMAQVQLRSQDQIEKTMVAVDKLAGLLAETDARLSSKLEILSGKLERLAEKVEIVTEDLAHLGVKVDALVNVVDSLIRNRPLQ